MDVTDAISADIEALVGGTTGRDLAMGGAFEGAERLSKALATWAPGLQSADADILPAKAMADARSRDITRNDGYVQSGANIRKDSIVGALYMLNARPNFALLGKDEKWAEEFEEEVESLFTAWAESPNYWVDAARTLTFTALVRLAVGVHLYGGEVLAVAEWLRDEPRPFQTAIQLVEADRLTTPFEMSGDTSVRGGIRMNRYGAPLTAYIRTYHPTDFLRSYDPMQYRAVAWRKPWGRQQVIHIHEQVRIDQTRGISELVAGLKTTQIAKKFRDITLQNAVLNASFAASIESELPDEAVYQQLGAGGSVGDAVVNYAEAYLGAIAQYAGGSRNMSIDGIKIPHLFPGTKLQLRPAGSPGGVGQDFEVSLNRHLAAILGTSYEELTHDYSKTNYSSAKAGKGDTGRFMASKKKLVADGFANHVYSLWLEEAINKGRLTTVKASDPNFYEGLNKEAYCRAEWIGAGVTQIDELKETQAAALRIKYNLSTMQEETARLGKDWRRVLRQREKEQKLLIEAGLVLDPAEDQMMQASTGEAREKEEAQ
jgi:lambda family phage portal protein